MPEATEVTNSSAVSLSSGTSSSTTSPPTKRFATNGTHHANESHSATSPQDLCAATLPTTLSSSASSVSECPPVAVPVHTIPKQSNFVLSLAFRSLLAHSSRVMLNIDVNGSMHSALHIHFSLQLFSLALG